MPRKCPDWLDTFMKWTLPRSEAPESYIYWTGLFTLSCVLRRKVKIPKSILGSWECPPHLYIMFIGPPGGPKKTTTMSYAGELLEVISDITPGPTIVSQASLLDKMVEAEDSSVYIVSEEFSDLIMKSKGDMFEFLTSMYDGKKSIEASTISRGAQFAERPCINMIAGTTPAWVSENMSEAVIGGGYSSRVVFIFEEESRRKRLIYKGKIDPESLEGMRSDLREDLVRINNLNGDFDITDAAAEWLDGEAGWYQTRKKETNRNLIGYFNREPAHLLKTAMLLQVSRSDELILDVPVIKDALEVLGKIKGKLPRVFEGVGKNPYTFDMRHIIEYIRDNVKVEKTILLQQFNAAAPPGTLEDLISALISMRQIKSILGEDKKMYYAVVEK